MNFSFFLVGYYDIFQYIFVEMIRGGKNGVEFIVFQYVYNFFCFIDVNDYVF